MDKAFQIGLALSGIDRFALQVELDDVIPFDAIRGAGAREQKALRVVGMAHADVAE